MGLDQLQKGLGFSLYPLSFFLYSLFKETVSEILSDPPCKIVFSSKVTCALLLQEIIQELSEFNTFESRRTTIFFNTMYQITV